VVPAVDDQDNALEAEELRREISHLRRAIRTYRMQVFHTKQYTCRHDQMERRLQKIVSELKALNAHPSKKGNERREKAG
jgi:hypothetical protein